MPFASLFVSLIFLLVSIHICPSLFAPVVVVLWTFFDLYEAPQAQLLSDVHSTSSRSPVCCSSSLMLGSWTFRCTRSPMISSFLSHSGEIWIIRLRNLHLLGSLFFFSAAMPRLPAVMAL